MMGGNEVTSKRAVRFAWHAVRLWLLYALTLLCFENAERLARVYPADISVRFSAPLTKVEAQSLTKSAEKLEYGLSLTLWRQEQAVVFSPRASATARRLMVYGDSASVVSEEMLLGALPGVYDTGGCAVSEQLAWRLWGGSDVLGLTVTCGDKCYTVRGVLRSGEPLLVTISDSGEGSGCVELTGLPKSDRRQSALDLLRAAGIGTPATMIYGASIRSAADTSCFFAVSLAGLLLLGRLVTALFRRLKRWTVAIVLLVLGVVLPLLVSLLPAWAIPSRWSDFSFWGALLATLAQRLAEWYALVPLEKDVQAKQLIVRQAALAAGILTVYLARPNAQRTEAPTAHHNANPI